MTDKNIAANSVGAEVFPVRYVRDWLNGSTSNAGDHWVEIEVWGWADVTYIGNYYEWKGSPNNSVNYYYAGPERVAMRWGSGAGSKGVTYLLSDHLGSTSITADPVNGNQLTAMRYYPWGEERYANGTLNTTIRFTGQRQEEQLGGSEGLYYYGARWYDPVLGRFASPDTIVPEPYNPQDWDRYAYVRNNPLRYIDPTGHKACFDEKTTGDCKGGVDRIYPPRPFVPLTRAGQDGHFLGGEDVFQLYQIYQNTPGWWNEGGNFTLAAFVGLWILHEASWKGGIDVPYEDMADLLVEVVAQNLYVGGFNNPYCPSGSCYNGVFNYMAAASKGGDALFRFDGKSYAGPASLGAPGDPNGIMNLASEYGSAALHPTSLNWDRNDAPSAWGNNRPRIQTFTSSGMDPKVLYGPNDAAYYYYGTWFVYSVNQSARWPK